MIKYKNNRLGKCILLGAITFSLLGNVNLFAQNGVIKGRVINGTTGNDARVESIVLTGASQAGMEELQSKKNVNGSFEFKDVKPSPGMPYVLQATYKGIQYSSTVQLPANTPSVVAEVTVYEPSTDENLFTIVDPQFIFRRSGSQLEIVKVVIVENESNPAYTFTNTAGTVKFTMQQDSRGINYMQAKSGTSPFLNIEPIESDIKGTYAADYPIKPGMTELRISYSVPYPDAGYNFSEELLYSSERLFLLTQPANMAINGEGLIPAGGDASNDFNIYRRDNVKVGDVIEVSLAGGTASQQQAAQPQQNIMWSHNRFYEYNIFIIVFLLAVLMAGTMISKNKKPVKEEAVKGPLKKLVQKKKNLLGEIAALDDVFADAKISEKEYNKQRIALNNQLVEVYKKL